MLRRAVAGFLNLALTLTLILTLTLKLTTDPNTIRSPDPDSDPIPTVSAANAQVHWLTEHAAANLLLDEVEAESDRVWNFIIAREIETPDRFRAIQSYRCAHIP